jgi:hypothetical protein
MVTTCNTQGRPASQSTLVLAEKATDHLDPSSDLQVLSIPVYIVETPLPQRLSVIACETAARATNPIHSFLGLDLLHPRQAYKGGLEATFLLAGY